ncbi:ALDH-like protein [Lentithecium fluviatile CBS 122367]|uniref:ALDH-like protein n=1 Tax=Lentithecium fluviatile CBS 122367 TaxID=1168545 RepID=A0A6G1JFQ5_9PLEO|nr:ALDH-like protein [Lentithecium fluviatile CBS 122367]
MTDDLTIPLFINGEKVTHSSTFDVISPSTGATCWKAVSATPEDAIKAVETAKETFPAWSQTKPSARIAILLKAADILEKNAEEYATHIMTEMGADRGTAQFFVLPLAIAMCRDIAGRISSVCGGVPVVAKEGQSAMVWKEPYGFCLGIVAWNAPYVIGIRSAATAIATGNTTVIKSSELTPRCYLSLVKASKDAGLPDGVFNVVTCRREDAPLIVNTMIDNPAVRKINFTGSASTGRKIARTCVGGKNSAVVLADADLEAAARECLAGAFLKAGQICMGTDRILCHSSIASNLMDIMTQQLKETAKGSEAPPKCELVSEAISQGAQLVAGTDAQADIPSAGFVPTILSNFSETSSLHHQEAFNPLVTITTFDTDDQAIELANDTEYGLHAAVFTKDLRKGLAMAKRLEAGAVHINSMTVHDEPALPMGGVKGSGCGRFNAQGMEEFLFRKAVTWDV